MKYWPPAAVAAFPVESTIDVGDGIEGVEDGVVALHRRTRRRVGRDGGWDGARALEGPAELGPDQRVQTVPAVHALRRARRDRGARDEGRVVRRLEQLDGNLLVEAVGEGAVERHGLAGLQWDDRGRPGDRIGDVGGVDLRDLDRLAVGAERR